MARPLDRKPRRIPPDDYDPDPPTPDSLADWAPIDDRLKKSETKIVIELTIVGIATAAITFGRRTASAVRRVGIPQLPPKDVKDALLGGVSLLITTISLYKILIAYLAASPLGTTIPLLAGAGIFVLALMAIVGRRK